VSTRIRVIAHARVFVSAHSSSLLDRALQPSMRLMARLRFNQKALLIGASFTLTCAVLTGMVMVRTNAEIDAVRLQSAATEGLGHLHRALLAVQEHEQLVVRAEAKDAVPAEALARSARAVDGALDALADWQRETLPEAPLQAPLQAARRAWAEAAAPHADAAAAEADHAAATARIAELTGLVHDHSGLILATDPAVFYTGLVAAEWLPMFDETATQQGLVGIRVLGAGAIWVDDRTGLAVSKQMQQFVRGRIEMNLKKAEAEMPALADSLGKPLRTAFDAMGKQNDLVQKHVLDAETPVLPVKVMAARAEATRLAMAAAMTAANHSLQAATAAEIATLRQRATYTGLAVALALLLSAYLFCGFTRGTRAALRRIEDGATLLARGEFPDAIRVDTRDELREIGGSMERAAGTLRNFADAQRVLFDAHQQGDIDQRLDAAAFPGSFGVMADEINTLVASHTDVTFELVSIISDYARGDLSRDMERLPGKKGEITAAADAFKAQTLAVNAQIKALVDAAVAGDFSQRGDAQRFEFVYREMIDDLNTLMTSADTGLGEVGALLSAVADGSLDQRITARLAGRFGELAADANRTVDQLAQIVGQIRAGSDAINAAAGEIAAGNDDLSRRTEQQAASLEETASSMEELTSTVRQNADNARQANQLAIGAVDVASQGGEVVGRVVQTMSAISQASSKIADIIGVIDGIAFQTNILALNAAVEAARAGEQGRGFAVVASEVRSLAQRSAAAAKEIKGLITDSADKVGQGNALVDQAGRTMGEIVTSVKRVTDIIADISAASQEQSAGIEQVNHAITQMDEGTQQNAALVEEATASARSLELQAAQLVQMVAVFRLGAGRTVQPVAEVALVRPTVVAMPKPARKVAAAATRARTAHKARNNGNGAAASDGADWQEF
jgi:methyl-accepting chemotaxis protein